MRARVGIVDNRCGNAGMVSEVVKGNGIKEEEEA
jgi:hypothetical protein